MRPALARLPLVVLLGACRFEPPPAADRSEVPARPQPGAAGGQFFCRTDRGQTRELTLRKLATSLTLKPGTVRSRLTMEVAGPNNERVEAVIRLAVPRGAAVTGATLWVDDHPMNGAFVQRDRARDIYRSIVERRRDPALITWDGPGWVSVSIFPLERGEPRRFELEWIEPAAIDGGIVRYRVPRVANAGRVIARASLDVEGRPLPADGDAVALAPVAAAAARIVADRAPGDPFHRLLVRSAAGDATAHVVIAAETSAAMDVRDRVRQRAAIGTVLDALPATSKVTLLSADWNVSALADQATPAAARQALDQLDAIPSAGALHLERALTSAAARAGTTAVLFVGRGMDGFAGDAIHGPLARLRDAGVRLSLVTPDDVPGPLADAAALTGGEALPAVSLDADLAALIDALRARPAPPALAARGLDWRALQTVTGQTVWVGHALEVPRPEANAGAQVASADASDLLPLWDRARLAWSDHADHPDAQRSTTTALTPLRALLVLESGQDYGRFGLAAPDGPGQRPRMALPGLNGKYSMAGADAQDVLGHLMGSGVGGAGTGEGTMGLGNIGTIGQAYGEGGRRERGPEIVAGQATVRGDLDREIIRRIVRRHINELKFCYEQALSNIPHLGGRILVQFTVDPAGNAVASRVQSSTVGSARVENCFVQAVRRWEFPRTLGGVVSYPFVLTPGTETGVIAPPPPDKAAAADVSMWDTLVALDGKGDLPTRVQHVAALLGLDRTSDAESLAWMIDRRDSSGREILLVARLLAAAHRDRDAIRILSEWAATMPIPTAEELRRLGADTDANEVLTLSQRER